MFPVNSGQTTFQERDLLRASNNSRSSCIPDDRLRSTRKELSGRGKGPRLPQRSRYVSDYNSVGVKGTLLARSVMADSAPQSQGFKVLKKDPETLDSGLGIEDSFANSSIPTSLDTVSDVSSESNSALDSDSDDEIEMDCVHTMRRAVTPDSVNSYLREEEEKYRLRIEEIKKQATERFKLSKGLESLLPNSDGDNGFHQAIIHNQANMLSRLLELVQKYPNLHSNINDQNALFQTPLHLAVHTQQTDVISKLIKADASLHLADHKGNTPLHIAASSSIKSLDVILSEADKSTILEVSQIRNNHGLTCVHLAVMKHNAEALLKLKEVGVDMNMQDHTSGRTPLHLAVEMGAFQLVQLLMQLCNANFNATTYSGCTPLHMAAGRGHIEIVAYLISLGANPIASTDEGETALELSSTQAVSELLNQVVKTVCIQ